MKDLKWISSLLPFAMIAAAIAAWLLGSRAITSIFRRSIRKTMLLPSAVNSQSDLAASSATAQRLLSKEFEGRSTRDGDDWIRFPSQQRARALRVYLVCGAVMTLILSTVLLIGYPGSGLSWFVFNVIPYLIVSAITVRALRKPRRDFLGVEVIGLLLGVAVILCVGATVLWLSGPAESLVLIGLSLFLLVLVAFSVAFLIVRSERSSSWSGQMRIIALYWAIIPAMTFFSLYNRVEHPAFIVIAIYFGFAITFWFSLYGVSSAARIAPRYRLLLLRSFPKQPKKTIIHPLINNWAYLGEVLMLAGPDLVGITLGPSELGRFLTGRIRTHFIQNEAELDSRLSATNRPPYRDGRYRIVAFACMADTWGLTFRRLISSVDTVLFDLRGFGASHQGAAFELEEIVVNEDIRHRTIVVTDEATDIGLVDRIIRGALVSGALENGPRIVQVGSENGGEVATLLSLLIQAAEKKEISHPV